MKKGSKGARERGGGKKGSFDSSELHTVICKAKAASALLIIIMASALIVK